MKELAEAQASLADGAVVNLNSEAVIASNIILTPEQSVKVMNTAVGS
ncbi:hypothetical protein [Enterococcus faecalis]|nr:hypothetical protein [Enterococcus faecalis]MEB7954622.1 hypothetical protein [Enterococcus faecalis]MEB7964791.1 hypothetical protein [Enterococcus faecalis]